MRRQEVVVLERIREDDKLKMRDIALKAMDPSESAFIKKEMADQETLIQGVRWGVMW